ncbi:MAG: single-stranded DNA-binding protein [Eubacteriales bacterium]
MNICAEIGRLTTDVELKYTQNEVPVCTFTLAVYRSEDTTDFLPCVAWRETARFISRYFRKGQLIGISGSVQSRKYKDKNGNPHTAIEICVDKATFCQSKSSDAEYKATGGPQNLVELGMDEDIPF